MTEITIRTLHTTPPAIVPALVPPIVPPIVPALSVGSRVGGARVGDGATVESVEERHTRNNIFVLGQSQWLQLYSAVFSGILREWCVQQLCIS